MKQKALLRHLRKFGCYLKRQGKEHELWCNPATGYVEAVPRHVEIPNGLARKKGYGPGEVPVKWPQDNMS